MTIDSSDDVAITPTEINSHTHGRLKKYNRADKERFAIAWILSGNVSKASESCGIPTRTAGGWMQKAWWPSLVDLMRIRHRDQIEAKYEQILDKGTDQLLERLDNGDPVLHKGVIQRVPVPAKELSQIIGTTQDKLRISRDQPNNISVSATMDLRRAAANFARAGRIYQYTLHGKEKPTQPGLPMIEEHGNAAIDNIDDVDVVADFELDDSELDTDEQDEDDNIDEPNPDGRSTAADLARIG